MVMKALKKYSVYCILLLSISICGCELERDRESYPSVELNFAATLKNHHSVSMKVNFEFKDDTGLKEFKKRIGKIKYATKLLLRQQDPERLKKDGQRKMTNSMVKICDQLLRRRPSRIIVSKFSVKEKRIEVSEVKKNSHLTPTP